MRKQKSVLIEGRQYELTCLGGQEGRILVVKFVQLLGRTIPVIASSGGGLSQSAVVGIAKALDGLDPVALEPLWNAFSENAWVKGTDGKSRELVSTVFDDHFAGDYFAMISFFVQSARFNFGDFLERTLELASAAPDTDPTASPSKSPKVSTGTSGA